MINTKFFLVFLISVLGISCNKQNLSNKLEVADSISRHELSSEEKTAYANPNPNWDGDTEYEYSNTYQTIKKGEYHIKSSDPKFLEFAVNEISSQVISDTMLFKSNKCQYLANDKPIVLFNNVNPKSKADVAGLLKNSSFLIVDSVYYQNIYINSDKAPMSLEKWYALLENETLKYDTPPLTYEVWSVVYINGKRYYTDYKLHNYIEYSVYLPQKKQMLLILSQGTGYDGGYNNGYPDLYEVIVFQKLSNTQDWVQIYRSSKLDLNNGGEDEYGISDCFIAEPIDVNKRLFTLNCSYWSLTWNGKDLNINWNKKAEEGNH